MPYKDPEKRKAYAAKKGAEWYQQNKALTKSRARARNGLLKQEWLEFKAAQSCSHCGASHPAIIDFHHVDRTGKQSVWALVRGRQYKAAMQEVKKCIPLCANCHRILHWKEAMELKRIKKHKKVLKNAKKRA